jgi:hypothetical protein
MQRPRIFPWLGISFWGVCALSILFASCIRQEFHLDEGSSIAGHLDPSFAIPLGSATFLIEDGLETLNSEQIESDPTQGWLQYVQPFDMFDAPLLEMTAVYEPSSFSWNLEPSEAQALSMLPKGQAQTFQVHSEWPWVLENMPVLDSIQLGSAQFTIHATCMAPLDMQVQLTCGNLFVGGVAASATLEFEYNGTLPMEASASINADNALIDFSQFNTPVIPLDWTVVATSNGEMIDSGMVLSCELTCDDVDIQAAYGMFGMDQTFAFESNGPIPGLAGVSPGMVHFADPRVRLWMENSSGVPVGLEWEELSFFSSSGMHQLGGTDISEFPVIAAAPSPGTTAVTSHELSNSGILPSLSSVFDAMPDSMSFSGIAAMNPEGPVSNFLLSSSTLSCSGELQLPIQGWAHGIIWNDTIYEPIAQRLAEAISPPLDWQDLERLTIRLRCTNGLPVGLSLQTIFMDDQGVAIDSLGSGAQGMEIIAAGQVNSNLPSEAPNFGRVENPHAQTVDVVLDRNRALELMNRNCQSVVIRAHISTDAAMAGQDVRFYAEDQLRLDLGAKIDFNIQWGP